jgi:lipoprotein NlpI/transglutaminase-like putative cysteine protease
MTTGVTTRGLLALLIATAAAPIAAHAQVQSQVQTQPQANPQTPPLKEVQVGASAFTLAAPVPAWVDMVAIPAADTSRAVVGRLIDTQYLVGETNTVFVRRAITVSDPALLTAVGQLPIMFVPQYQQLKIHAIRVLRGAETLDRTSSSTIRFLQRETGLEQGVYTDAVTASILVNDLRVGDTLEFFYSLVGQNPVFRGKFMELTTWEQPYPTVLRRVILNHPVSRPVDWRLLGDGAQKLPGRSERLRNGVRQLRFEERLVLSTGTEPLTPPDYLPSRSLEFSEFTSWDEVAVWANALFQYDGGLDDDLRAVVAKLRARPTTEQRVVAALEFVQSEIRYFSVALGESSHRPTPPPQVLKRRYGDCKDKSLLLMTLLKELGVDSNPVLLRIGRQKGIDKLLPAPQLFNHVIVRATVDGKDFYLDPTRLGQHGRLARMGQAHEGTEVLLVGAGTGRLTTIASANAAELVRTELSEVATISKLGDEARFETRQVWHGQIAETSRVAIEHAPQERIVKLIADALEARYPGARLAGAPDIKDDRIDNSITVTAHYIVPKLAIEEQGNWFVRFVPANLRGALVRPSSATRQTPFKGLTFPYEGTYTFEVRFPDQVSGSSDPATETIENKYFRYAVTSSFRGSVSKTRVDVKTFADRVEAGDIQKFTEDLQSIDTATKGVVLVAKPFIKHEGSVAATDDIVATQRARLQEIVDLVSETIKSGKLSGSDLADAYCTRAEAYSSLDKLAEAMRDATEALKLAPNSAKHVVCRAAVYFHRGDFEESVADYSRAITLGSVRPRTFLYRGISRFYASDLEEAAEDFAKASSDPKYDGLAFSDLWLTWTYRRLGRPIPDAVAKRAAQQPRGDWPRPALAMLNGIITPDEMLKSIDDKTGDDRKMALTEAYFYLGEHYLARREVAEAQDYFEKARRLGVFTYTEYTTAGFELQQLADARQSRAR